MNLKDRGYDINIQIKNIKSEDRGGVKNSDFTILRWIGECA